MKFVYWCSFVLLVIFLAIVFAVPSFIFWAAKGRWPDWDLTLLRIRYFRDNAFKAGA
jgi:hypothetical protein